MAVDTDSSFAIWVRGGGAAQERCIGRLVREQMRRSASGGRACWQFGLQQVEDSGGPDVLLRVLRRVAISCSFCASLEEVLSFWARLRLISERLGLVVIGVRACVGVSPGVAPARGRGGDDSGV